MGLVIPFEFHHPPLTHAGVSHRKAINMMKTTKASASFKIALFAAIIFSAPLAMAQEKSNDAVVDIIPVHAASGDDQSTPAISDSDATHPPLRITPDKSELVRLDRDAASIIVGNPLHINIMADSPRTLVVIPRSAGATYFTVLDSDGAVIMQRHVIVGSGKDGYVRVKRVCNTESKGCQNTSVFYCPDMCHEIGSSFGEKTDSAQETDSAEQEDDSNKVYTKPAEDGAAEETPEGTTEE
jgi:Flp pilus assembly secretin CpaC